MSCVCLLAFYKRARLGVVFKKYKLRAQTCTDNIVRIRLIALAVRSTSIKGPHGWVDYAGDPASIDVGSWEYVEVCSWQLQLGLAADVEA